MRIACLTIILFITSQLTADDDDIFSLSLEELLEVEFVTVSKKAEPLLTAPGIITLVTAKDIQSFGARHIKDVLQRLPNLFIFDSSNFSATGVMMRSGATQHLNNHVLYLINGRPLRESQNGGLHIDINLLLPVESIERIEMIRGPGSVLYGSNAFSGTINFITKKGTHNTQSELTLEAGSNSYYSGYFGLYKNLGEQDNINVIINTIDYDGETLSYFDENNNWGSINSFLDGYNLMINADYQGFKANILVNEVDTPLVSGAFWWENSTEFTSKRRYYDIGYSTDLTEKWQLDINYNFNQSERFIAAAARPSAYFISDGSLYEFQLNGIISEDLQLVSGGINETIRGDLGFAGGKYKSDRLMLFGQFDYQLNDRTKLTAGIQWNNPDGSDSELSPRLAMNYQVDNNWRTKLLYSEAFRSPYGSELFFDASFLQGDENLKPETIKTIEFQSTYHDDTLFTAITLFYSRTNHAIGRARINNVNTFVNMSEEISYRGIEIEGRWALNDNWEMKGSATFQNTSNNSGYDDVAFASDSMFKIGLANQGLDGYQFGIWYSYFSDVNRLEDINNMVYVYNPDADAFGLLSISMNVNLGTALDMPDLNNINFSLYVNNLTDEEIYYPELGRKAVNTILQPHETSVNAKFKITF